MRQIYGNELLLKRRIIKGAKSLTKMKFRKTDQRKFKRKRKY